MSSKMETSILIGMMKNLFKVYHDVQNIEKEAAFKILKF